MEGVTGSIPVAPTIGKSRMALFGALRQNPPWPSSIDLREIFSSIVRFDDSFVSEPVVFVP
jgi:hypothetical protein